MRIVIKFAGALLEDSATVRSLAKQIADVGASQARDPGGARRRPHFHEHPEADGHRK